ncbi:hypothetical protein AC739_15555 [Planococcus glaciei]|uniref:hypothetical protein n=1 Tax=Planococcus glaciei TaxID=459472 RepID=UPI00069FBF65|nr:hypothetical protein [Planococcus glaciei]KOF09381.1 hypothetical protein AC739_15555 [Planococcus glaciei]
MPLYSLAEDELRSLCKKRAESLEYWLRRIIHEKFTSHYGTDYFNKTLENGESVIKGEISKKARARREAQPERYARDIDATLLDDVIAILCNNRNYKPFFKEAFANVSPLGDAQLRHILTKIWECRNPLSHANPISVRQAEQLLCYSNDIMDSLKKYYREQGINNMYNVPTILKMVDSFGNTIYRDQMIRKGDDTVIVSLHNKQEYYLRPSDTYSVEVEIDPSFDTSKYEISWSRKDAVISEIGNKLTINIENIHVAAIFPIICEIRTYNDWHKCAGGIDDELTILLKILPPNN